MSAHEVTRDEQYIKMTEQPVPGLILSLAVPTIISMMVTAIYNTADTYFVSKLGTSASGAVGIVMSLMALIQTCGFLVGMGAGSWMSRLLGQKKREEASEVAASGFYMAALIGILITVLGTAFLNPLVGMLGATETIQPYAMEYARYILYAAPFLIASFALNKMLCAEGKARFAMVGIAFGGILNIILDPIFIFGLHLGIAGAAIATALSQSISFLILLYMYLSGRTVVSIAPRHIAKKPAIYGNILKFGMPSFFRQGLSSVAMVALNMQAAVYGDAALSAMAIVTKIFMLIFSVVIGFGQGYQPVAGYNYGAKKYERVKKAFTFMLSSSTVFLTIFAVIGWFVSPFLIRLFIRNDAEVIRIGTESLRFQCIALPIQGMSVCCNMTFQSIGRSAIASFLSSARQGYVFLPIVFVLPKFAGITGVEAAQPLADWITFFLCIPFVVWYFKELKRLEEIRIQG